MKRKPIILIMVIVLATVSGFLIFGNKSSNHGSTPSQKSSSAKPPASEETLEPDTVIIDDFQFGPTKITVKKGTKVTWTNKDSARHDITPDNPSGNFMASKLLVKDESYSVTFGAVGSHAYHCSPHPYMKGIIEVIE